MENDRCVYLHVHHGDGYPVIFYVGKGTEYRAHSTRGRSDFWWRTVEKYGPHQVIIHQNNLSEAEALRLEIALIESIGRRDLGKGFLVNLYPGGVGHPKGVPCTPECKAKLSAHFKGRKMPPEFGEMISKAKKGKPSSLKGVKRSPETVAKMKEAWATTRSKSFDPMSSERKAQLSAFWKGKPKSEETKARMRKPHSAEHIANRVAARKRNREARLAAQTA